MERGAGDRTFSDIEGHSQQAEGRTRRRVAFVALVSAAAIVSLQAIAVAGSPKERVVFSDDFATDSWTEGGCAVPGVVACEVDGNLAIRIETDPLAAGIGDRGEFWTDNPDGVLDISDQTVTADMTAAGPAITGVLCRMASQTEGDSSSYSLGVLPDGTPVILRTSADGTRTSLKIGKRPAVEPDSTGKREYSVSGRCTDGKRGVVKLQLLIDGKSVLRAKEPDGLVSGFQGVFFDFCTSAGCTDLSIDFTPDDFSPSVVTIDNFEVAEPR